MYKNLDLKFDALVDYLAGARHGAIYGFLMASGLVFLAMIGRLTMAPVDAGLHFVTFFPAVTLAAVLGGVRAALFAMVISVLLANYLFFVPYYSLSLTFNPNIIWPNIVFFAEEMLVIAVIESLYRQRSKYVASAERLDQLTQAKK